MIPSTIRVRLLREHIVNAQTFKAGMVVNLPAQSAQFLYDMQVGEPADKVPAISLPPEPTGSGTPNRNPKRS